MVRATSKKTVKSSSKKPSLEKAYKLGASAVKKSDLLKKIRQTRSRLEMLKLKKKKLSEELRLLKNGRKRRTA